MVVPSDASRRLGLAPRIAVGLGLLLAIAGVLAPDGMPVEGLPTPVWVPIPDWLTIATLAAFAAAGVIFIIVVRPWQRSQREDENGSRRYREPERLSPLLASVVFLLSLTPAILLAVAFLILGQSGAAIMPSLLSLADLLPASPVAPAQPASLLTTGLIGTLMVLAGGGSLGLMLWLVLYTRRRAPLREASRRHGAVAAAVEDSLDDLRHEADPRAAIIRIYGNFERAVAAAEVPRRPWQTPFEFMRVVLASLSLPASAIASLTHLFERARFSQHPVGSDEREAAWRSLIEIRTALAPQEQGPTDAVSS